MSQQYPTSGPGGGFTVRSAPGAGAAPGYGNTPAYSGLMPTTTTNGGGTNQQGRSPQEELAYEETTTKISSPRRMMNLGLAEKYCGLGANFAQMTTTFYSFLQICMGLSDQTLAKNGPIIGLVKVLQTSLIYGLVGLIMGVGAQLLLQAGCQRISKKWKREHITQNQDQRLGIIKVALSDKIGLFFTGLGFIIDGISDLSFVYAFHIPWYVCILFGLMMNGLATWVYYDGDERFHSAYMVWWRLEMAKKAWAQAVLEKARILQGLSKDGKSLASQY
jgi:hypothetical protein